MCAGVYSKLKAFNVKWWPTYTANVGFSTSQPHALKREIYLMMSWARGRERAERGSETDVRERETCMMEREKEKEMDLKCGQCMSLNTQT